VTDFYNRPGDTVLAQMPAAVLGSAAASDDPSIATIQRLSTVLATRATEFSRYEAYYNGEHGMRFASADLKAAFAKTFGSYSENFCGLVVDAVEERLDLEGFRFPPDPLAPIKPAPAGGTEVDDTNPDAADPDAWRIWQDNQLDARSQIAHTEALIKSVCYVLVSPFEAERIAGRSPKITVEDPCEAYVELEPGTDRRLVGIKRWHDAVAQRTFATLYYPDRIEKWQTVVRTGANQYGPWVTADPGKWERRQVPGEAWPLPHSLGVVPLVPLINRPRLRGEGRSEIADIIPIQDAINKIATDSLITSDSTAFRQKWATGIEIPEDPDTGKPIETFRMAADRFISTSVPDAKFGQFESSELNGYMASIEQKISSIASISRTPYHYFLQHSGQPPSGDSIKSSETGLVRKARRKQRHFGEGWEEVMRLAFTALEDARGQVLDSEAQWADPESLTEAQHIDALGKKRVNLKVPLRQLWADAGYTPGQIAMFERMLKAEAAMLRNTVVEPVDPTSDTVMEQVQERVSA
jgi:hypothetical protein